MKSQLPRGASGWNVTVTRPASSGPLTGDRV